MIQKTYSKGGRTCRVTFRVRLPGEARNISLCGEFNGWDEAAHPMKRRKDGSFSVTVALQPGRQYRFRYLINGERWENDEAADAYVPNAFGSDDSVVSV